MWAALALLLAGAAARAHHRAACSYATTGYLQGVPLHLAVTYLTPGLADWRIAVPLQPPPPECGSGHVLGQEALVCDSDAPPRVHIIADRGGGRGGGGVVVHRTGWLQGYATVNVTVYCVFSHGQNMVPLAPNVMPMPPNMMPMAPNMPPVPIRINSLTDEKTPTQTPLSSSTPEQVLIVSTTQQPNASEWSTHATATSREA